MVARKVRRYLCQILQSDATLVWMDNHTHDKRRAIAILVLRFVSIVSSVGRNEAFARNHQATLGSRTTGVCGHGSTSRIFIQHDERQAERSHARPSPPGFDRLQPDRKLARNIRAGRHHQRTPTVICTEGGVGSGSSYHTQCSDAGIVRTIVKPQ